MHATNSFFVTCCCTRCVCWCQVKSAIIKLREPNNILRIPFRYEEFLPFLENDMGIIEDKKDGIYKVNIAISYLIASFFSSRDFLIAPGSLENHSRCNISLTYWC
jgi:hypothetical protein